MLVVAALGAAVLAAQQPRALSVPDFLGLDRPSEVALSPDGAWAAYTVTTTDLAGNRRQSDLWLVATTGTATPRRISTDSLGGRSARWSPDGRRLAYVSARGGTPQVWLWDAATDQHRQLTRLAAGATGPVWSPSGRYLAFASDVYPACPDEACNATRARAEAARPSQARQFDALPHRHWNTWEDGRRSHLFLIGAEGGEPRDLLAGRDWDAPVPPFGGAESYAFSPDERELAFTTKPPSADQGWTDNLDIYTVPVAGGAPVLVTRDMPGGDHTPVYSPDGRYLAFLSRARAGFTADRTRLMVQERRSGRIRELTRNFDYSIAEFAWVAGGGDDIFATTDKRQRQVLLHIVTATGDVHEILDGMNPTGISVAPVQPRRIAFVSDATHEPPQVYVWRADHERPAPPRALTRLNADRLAGVVMRPAREFAWTGAGGDSVFGLLVTPHDFDPSRRYPAVILIHGGPQASWQDNFHSRWNAQLFAAPGYVVALLNPRGSPGFGQRFVDEVSQDWGGRVYDDVMRGVDAVARLPWVDSTRMAAAGGSFGGYMANWINGQTTRFRALISHAGVFKLESFAAATDVQWFAEWEFGGPSWLDRSGYERFSPHRVAGRFRTPTLVIHGALDYRVPDTEGIQMFTALQRQGVPSRLLTFPDEGHFIGRPQNQLVWWNAVHAWLAQYLGRPASSRGGG